MKKKWMIGLLTVALALTMLVGCGTKTEGKETPTPEPTQQTQPTETPVPTEEPEQQITESPTPEPVVTLGEYKGLTLYEVDSSVVAEEMLKLLEEYGEYVIVDRAARESDAVNINYVGKKDGVAFEGGTDDSEAGYDLVLGSGSFIDGFEAGLVGAVAGEVRDLNLTFPESYGSEELAGQDVVFTVTVNAVKEWVVPELTDEFASENFGYATSAELILAVYDTLNQESFYEQITNALMETSQVENYPMDRIEAQKQGVIDYYTSYAEYYGMYYGMDTETALNYFMGFPSTETLASFAEEYAYELVKNELVMETLFAKELTEEDYQEKLRHYLTYYAMDEATFYEEYGGEENVRLQIKTELVFDYIISQATIVEAENDATIQ